jgi:hypothetical protein
VARVPDRRTLLPWFGGMWVLSGLSDVGGGAGVLGFWPAVILVAIWSVLVIALAQRAALTPEQTAVMMARMETTA